MSVPGPVLGPCESWIDGEDVAACCTASEGSSDGAFDQVAVEASMALYEISGRIYTGLCDSVVRPCRARCSCWGAASLGLGPWGWSSLAGGAWGWSNECGDRCGCGDMSQVKLSGYPVREITEVKIDGVVLDPLDDDGNPNYRLDRRRWLTRMDSPGPPVVKRRWPGCQNLSLEDTESGTFAISYRHGIDPPELGRRAAAAIACQLAVACGAASGSCALPTGTTRVTRQGVTVERQLLQSWLDPKKGTGIVAVDLFLATYWKQPGGRRAAVWSPDVQPFARRVGQ